MPATAQGIRKLSPRAAARSGFALLEMVMAMAVLLIVMGFAAALVARLEKGSQSTQARLNTEAQARSALALMAEEVELAGSNPTVDTVTNASVGPCASACTVTVASGAGIIVGDKVAVGAPADYETVLVTSVGNGSFTAALANAHAQGEPVIYPGYPYATGICPPNPSTGATGCSSTELQLFGNLEGNGALYFVQYAYNAGLGQLTRSITPVTAASKATAYVLCDSVTGAAFNVQADIHGNNTSVSLSLTVQSPYPDPQTGQYNTVSVQRGMVVARNVALASQMAANNNSSNIAPTPTGIANLVP